MCLCAAQILVLSEYPDDNMQLGYGRMKKIFDSHKDNLPSSIQDKAWRSLTLLSKVLGGRVHAIKSKSDVLILHLIASKLLPSYSINGFENKIGDFIIRFIGKVESLSKSANERSKNPYVRYAYFRRWANKRIQDKYKVMAGELLLAIPNMKRKDLRRRFNDEERYAIFLKANQKCEYCGNPTRFEDGDADHKIRHTNAGATSLSNGRWLCRKHNRS